jgi:hypothetical protein
MNYIDSFNDVINFGGEGSGNWDHEGRPGEVGGSGEGGGETANKGRADKEARLASINKEMKANIGNPEKYHALRAEGKALVKELNAETKLKAEEREARLLEKAREKRTEPLKNNLKESKIPEDAQKEILAAADDPYVKEVIVSDKVGFASVAKAGEETVASCSLDNKIYINPNLIKSLGEANNDAREQVESGWWPKGCDTYKSAIHHEVGHARYNAAPKDIQKLISKEFKSLQTHTGDIQKAVSGYAATNVKEFAAECYSEHKSSSSPRETASKIGKLLGAI